MDEEFSLDDPTRLLEAASDFVHYPGPHNDTSVKEFLDRFPLRLIISALQTQAYVPGMEDTLVACLERIFSSRYGASLIPQYLPFVQVGLTANSQGVRSLACGAVACLLENLDIETVSASKLIRDSGIYPLLLDCLINGDEHVATSSMDAIEKLAASPDGLEIIFPAANNEATDLGILTSRCSSLGQVRVMALVVKLFSVSISVASVIYKSNLLNLLVEEVRHADDTLVTLSILELLYEVVEVKHGTEFLSLTTLLQMLSSIISTSAESILRSRAMMISGRLLSKENIYSYVDEISVKIVISAIDGQLNSLGIQDKDECESALEALGQIGSSIPGASLLLTGVTPAARHVVKAAFDRRAHGIQLAALHALGNIFGETRSLNNILMNGDSEESLRRMIYEVASQSSKFTPSGLFLSVLQQDSEIRLASYRMISGLAARPWALMEICSKPDIVNIVTDANIETTKTGMEARHNCCKAIYHSLMLSNKPNNDPAVASTAAKLCEAIGRGPYLNKKRSEAQPIVMTAERF